jgi:galactose mutarotase-like enzyme
MGFESLRLSHGETSLTVAPWRGAIATHFRVGGEELFYLDETTLHDESKSVRGGNPLLWPFAGSLEGGRLAVAGTEIPQHGFARNRAWKVEEERGNRAILSLEDDTDSRAIFPWKYRLVQSFELGPGRVRIALESHNRGETPMPVAPGWHPYFACSLEEKLKVRTTLAGFPHERFAAEEGAFDFGVESEGVTAFDFQVGNKRFRLSVSPNMRWFQFWSLRGREFICVEPFAGRPNIINSPEAERVAPGGFALHWMELRLL